MSIDATNERRFEEDIEAATSKAPTLTTRRRDFTSTR